MIPNMEFVRVYFTDADLIIGAFTSLSLLINFSILKYVFKIYFKLEETEEENTL